MPVKKTLRNRNNKKAESRQISQKRCFSKLREMFLEMLVGEGLILLIVVLCYGNLFWMLPLQIFIFPYRMAVSQKKVQRKERQYLIGFREFLQSLVTSLQAGYSLENACRAACVEWENLFQSRKNPTMDQLRKIVYGIELQLPLEELFMNYAEETGIEEIYQFAVVLDISRNTGGNVVEILKTAMVHLEHRMNAEEEIRVLLSGKIFEKNIMLLMPFGMLLYLRLTNPQYVSCFYNTAGGHVLMTGFILAVVVCFFWTEKIMDISF